MSSVFSGIIMIQNSPEIKVQSWKLQQEKKPHNPKDVFFYSRKILTRFPLQICILKSRHILVRQTYISRTSKMCVHTYPSVSLWASFASSLLYRVLRGEGDPWNDSWHVRSHSSTGWAVWYQHFSAWLWTSKTGGFAMISPGYSSTCISCADLSCWSCPTVPVNPEKFCVIEKWQFLNLCVKLQIQFF